MPDLAPHTPKPSREFEGFVACTITEVEPYATSKDVGLRVKLSNGSFVFFFSHPFFVEKLRKQIRMQVPEVYSEKLEELVNHAIGFKLALIFERTAKQMLTDDAVCWLYQLIDPVQPSEETCTKSSTISELSSLPSSSED